MNLFEAVSEKIIFDLPDAEIVYYPNFFDQTDANAIFEKLKTSTNWQQDEITVFGKKHLQPRLTALFGNNGKSYSYSNIKMMPSPWTALLEKIKLKIQSVVQTNFSTVLLNFYRSGQDSNGWHADDEKELGQNPVIASVSFGAPRFFYLKHITNKSLKQKILLEHGSLLVMSGTTQHFWKHQIPKTTKQVAERINLTFRLIR